VEEAAAAALARAGRADVALLFATPGYGSDAGALLDAAVSALGTESVVGASAHGGLAVGRECEAPTCLAVLARSGLDAHPFLLTDLAGDEAHAGEEIAARIGGAPRPEDLVVLLPDPRAIHADALLAGVRAELAPAAVVGAGAADPIASSPLQWCGRRARGGGVAGVVLRGRRPPRIGVTQSCRPATELLCVTRAQGNWVLELDGRPALDVYREVARAPLAEDLRRAAAFLLVALPRDESAPLAPGGYLVRNVAGFAPAEHAFAIPEPVRRGQRIALALREPASARADLKEMLAGLHPGAPAAALYFDCCARGSSFFGVEGLEAAYLESALGDVPLAGLFGSCEIGPVGGRTELLTYTGVLALLDDAG
jgi:small ligand-binding sensory domain FIST